MFNTWVVYPIKNGQRFEQILLNEWPITTLKDAHFTSTKMVKWKSWTLPNLGNDEEQIELWYFCGGTVKFDHLGK